MTLFLEVESRVAWYFLPAMRLLLWSAGLVNRAVWLRVGKGPWEPIPLVEVVAVEVPQPSPLRECGCGLCPPPLEKCRLN